MQKKLSLWMLSVLMLMVAFGCKKDKDGPSGGNNNGGSSEAVLMIQTPAQNVEPGVMLIYSAVIVKKDGTSEPASATWSTSNADVASFSGTTLTAKSEGDISVTAKVTYKGANLQASVALGVKKPSLFAVAPAAIVWREHGEAIQLNPVYIGTQNPGTYTYSSSDATIASVSSSGSVSCLKAGFCVITVTATGLTGKPAVTVPVQVIAVPAVELPIARITITPDRADLFKNETKQFSAKAYDINGNEKTTSFVWKIANDTLANVSVSGLVTAKSLGKTYVMAEANGVVGQAEVTINPSKIIELDPYYADIDAGSTRQFTAKTYSVSRSGAGFTTSQIPNPADLKWEVPTYGVAMLDIATVNQSGLVSMKSDATRGMASIVMAYSPSDEEIEPGVALISVSMCDCGSNNPNVNSITTAANVYNISITNPNPTMIQAEALDAFGAPVSNADIKYCSDATQIATVDPMSGTLLGASPGTANIKICVGSVTKTVTVNVTF